MKSFVLSIIAVVYIIITIFVICFISLPRTRTHNNDNKMEDGIIYDYKQSNHILTDKEIEMINYRNEEARLPYFESYDIKSKCDIIISSDYDRSHGLFILYSNLSYSELEKFVIENYKNNDNMNISEEMIIINDSYGEIMFLKNRDNNFSKIIYYTLLPYKYDKNSINNYSILVKYFLNINDSNIKKNNSKW